MKSGEMSGGGGMAGTSARYCRASEGKVEIFDTDMIVPEFRAC